jgi:hypothetical protein
VKVCTWWATVWAEPRTVVLPLALVEARAAIPQSSAAAASVQMTPACRDRAIPDSTNLSRKARKDHVFWSAPSGGAFGASDNGQTTRFPLWGPVRLEAGRERTAICAR